MEWMTWIGVGYLCGATPFALLLGWLKGVDVRRHGSGNVGATNVGRVLGRRWGIACFALDVMKGAVPVLGAGWQQGWLGGTGSGVDAWRWLAVAAAAMLGHIFPVWLRFKGGKGVATGFGVLLGVWPMLTLPAVAAAVTWVIVVKLFRYVSLASMVGAGLLPVYVIITALLARRSLDSQIPFLTVTVLMAVMVALRHRANIGRLLQGTEPRIGQPKPQPTDPPV